MDQLRETKKHEHCARILSLFIDKSEDYIYVPDKYDKDSLVGKSVVNKYIGAVLEVSVPYKGEIIKSTKNVELYGIPNDYRISQKSDTAIDLAGEIVIRAIGRDKVDKMLLSMVKKQYERYNGTMFSKWEVDFTDEQSKIICEMISEIAHGYYKEFMKNYSTTKEMESINMDYYVDELKGLIENAVKTDKDMKQQQ